VAAPSNSAADLLAERLILYGRLSPKQLTRIYAFSRLQDSLPENLLEYAKTGKKVGMLKNGML